MRTQDLVNTFEIPTSSEVLASEVSPIRTMQQLSHTDAFHEYQTVFKLTWFTPYTYILL